MESSTSVLLIIFGIIVYVIAVDENVSTYLFLLFKLTKSNISKYFWIMVYHPNNFVTTWVSSRKYDKIAKELQDEFNLKNKGE